MNQKKINEIIREHGLWLNDQGGERADLSGSDLRGSNLRGSNLRGSNLHDSDLSYSDLRGSDLRGSDLIGSDLRGSNLRDSNLIGSNLRGINLWNAIGNNRHIKTIQAGKYIVTYTSENMSIGCESHSIKDWWKFDDDTIDAMDTGALEWWKVWKPILKKIIKVSPAEPTGYAEAEK